MPATVTALPGGSTAPRPAVRKSIQAALRSSMKAMDGLSVADEAAIALGMAYARRLDQVLAEVATPMPADADPTAAERIRRLEAEVSADKLLGWLGPHLANLLRDLGGTPAARSKSKAPVKKVGSALAQERAVARAARAAR